MESALTLAAARPRDEKEALDKILISCQRPGLAAMAQYKYAKGGTDISGASIRLLEAIAQRWGNVSFGFYELARYASKNGTPGESVVEAFAWDLESNVPVRMQFTVEHAMRARGGTKTISDPREIYEWIANQAARRVRKCLEQVIPRDIVESALEECDRTLHASIKDPQEAARKMVTAFEEFGVTREQIEARIQRRIDAITVAQIIGLRKIYASIKDGMSEPADWFDAGKAEDKEQPAATAMDKAKDALRKQSAPPKPAPPKAPETPVQQPEQPTTDDGGPTKLDEYAIAVNDASQQHQLASIEKTAKADSELSAADKAKVAQWCLERRGELSNAK